MHENERLETYQVKKNLENHLEKWFGVRESDLGGKETEVSRERDQEKWSPDHTKPIYRSSVILDR